MNNVIIKFNAVILQFHYQSLRIFLFALLITPIIQIFQIILLQKMKEID